MRNGRATSGWANGKREREEREEREVIEIDSLFTAITQEVITSQEAHQTDRSAD